MGTKSLFIRGLAYIEEPGTEQAVVDQMMKNMCEMLGNDTKNINQNFVVIDADMGNHELSEYGYSESASDTCNG